MDFNMKDEQNWEREQHINLQVQALHREIDHKRFTLEVISTIHHQLIGPTSENSINKEILNRYIGTLGADEKHRISCELEIFGSTGQISSYFVRGQELDTFAVEEMIQIVKEWTKTCQRATRTQENLKDLRWALAREELDFVREKRQDELDDDGQESKRTRKFNDLYDATPERKRRPRANVEREVDETNTMDLN
ncbi:hypothetical protein L207DRAFT_523895 [Hyaloscypha variabilis F]|uniref:Uncharacterized protein n=1 Tax=Hyaloscypha variabilis (strain UAMH 11265 / GT02V1 / F) TaxID=1149755 RepID=A0A2J6S6W6_HYAVF|nr:hypothetical protein L207DRAFT_523895 [Hyaloscypha variabilis F]